MKGLPEVQVVDIDKEPELVKKYNVRGVPTLVLLDDEGVWKDQCVGNMSSDRLREFLA
jgi:thioredoxin-like negative regulator of GroEL